MFFKKEKMFECILIGVKEEKEYYAVRESKNEKFFIAFLKGNFFISNEFPTYENIKDCRKAFKR